MVTYVDNTEETFFLEGQTVIEGVDYLVMKSITKEEADTNIVGYIRTERGDTTVYARTLMDEEFILYDFGTFKPGSLLRYSERDTVSHQIHLNTDVIDADSLTYYHDVIETGDILPCYNDIVFKVGHLGGPMYLINNMENYNGYGDKPKRKNISHTILKLTNKAVELTPSGIIPITAPRNDNRCHNLQGMCVTTPKRGIHIINGKKYLTNR